MNDSSSVLLHPGEGFRWALEDGRPVVTHQGYDVRVGEPINPAGGHWVNLSGQDQVVSVSATMPAATDPQKRPPE